ncbi:resistin-like [Bufo bufo]|uniref:resistin-like n=1 Tax=Bufo bufo TaxID=8384 RepID=UPI001ABE8BB7|nr:resistin-like [Bufo bufo]
MKFVISAAILLLVPALIFGQGSPCGVDNAIRSIVSQYSKNIKFECKSISDGSAYSSCPSGYIAASCSCGMSCGSWDIQGSNKCHCQCGNMDWTTAVCCRITS